MFDWVTQKNLTVCRKRMLTFLPYIPNSAFRSSVTPTFHFWNSSPRSVSSFPPTILYHSSQSSIKAYTLQTQITTVNTTEHNYNFTTWVKEKSISPPNSFSLTSLTVLRFYKRWDVVTEQRKKMQVRYHDPINFSVCYVRNDSKIHFWELD